MMVLALQKYKSLSKKHQESKNTLKYCIITFFKAILKTKFDSELIMTDSHWLVVRVFVNGQGDLGSVPGHVIAKTLKMVLDTSLLNTQQYKNVSRVKWSNPGKGVAPNPTP